MADVWNCTFENKTAELKDLTVGQKFNLECAGPEVSFEKDKLVILDPAKPEDTFAKQLVILQVQDLAPSKAVLVATSYKPGNFSGEKLKLTDGTKSVELGGFNYEVKSVIEKGVQPTPAPGYGPYALSIGWIYWALLALVILAACYRLFAEYKKWTTRRRLFDELKNYKTARPPYDELHSELRKLERAIEMQKIGLEEFFANLDRAYRLFLIRELEVPALDWSDTDIVKEVKRRHRYLYDHIRKDLIDYFSEMRKIKKALKPEDVPYLIKNCQKISDKVSDFKTRELNQKAGSRV